MRRRRPARRSAEIVGVGVEVRARVRVRVRVRVGVRIRVKVRVRVRVRVTCAEIGLRRSTALSAGSPCGAETRRVGEGVLPLRGGAAGGPPG